MTSKSEELCYVCNNKCYVLINVNNVMCAISTPHREITGGDAIFSVSDVFVNPALRLRLWTYYASEICSRALTSAECGTS